MFNQLKARTSQIIGNYCNSRGFQQVATPNLPQFTEVKIPVPWGHISGKLWGAANQQPILAVHDHMANANSFDNIISHVNAPAVLAIDMPGHGLSSWLPKGMSYTSEINLQTIHRLKAYFGWSKVKLLGHGSGGIFNFYYASIFPEHTQFVINIDSPINPLDNIIVKNRMVAKSITKLIKNELKQKPLSTYTKQKFIKKFLSEMQLHGLDEITAANMIARAMTENADGTVINNQDNVLLKYQGSQETYTIEHFQQMAELITCPYLVFECAETFKMKTNWNSITDILQRRSIDFKQVNILGAHYVHVTQPVAVAPEINLFLQKHNIDFVHSEGKASINSQSIPDKFSAEIREKSVEKDSINLQPTSEKFLKEIKDKTVEKKKLKGNHDKKSEKMDKKKEKKG